MHCDAIVRGSRCSSESTKYQQPLNKSSIRSWADVCIELLRQTYDYAEVQHDVIAFNASDNCNNFLLSRNYFLRYLNTKLHASRIYLILVDDPALTFIYILLTNV